MSVRWFQFVAVLSIEGARDFPSNYGNHANKPQEQLINIYYLLFIKKMSMATVKKTLETNKLVATESTEDVSDGAGGN